MAEASKHVCNEIPVGREEMGFVHQDGSYAIDMEELSPLVDPGINEASTTTPRPPTKPFQKTLLKKASQRIDRKAAADGDTLTPATTANIGGSIGGAALPSPAAASPHAAAASDRSVSVALSLAAAREVTAAPFAATSPWQAAPFRRSHGRRAAAAPWFHPRRVLVFFATLSSMGTIILLYFTLSMGKMADGDANAR
uniref:Replicase polyprotein 1ab n=2 Tax=Anthurium amnicola TaxID=1678845 RepID=A0A1D1XFB7_9ARAE